MNPLQPRWDLGLIPCTSGKNPHGTTPLTLYQGGPFATMVKHALQRCDQILIMSAKYGLLALDAPVAWYNAYLPDLDAVQRQLLAGKMQAQLYPLRGRRRVISYLPLAYHQFLRGTQGVGELAVDPICTAEWIYRRPYHNVGMITAVGVLSRETKNYGTHPARR